VVQELVQVFRIMFYKLLVAQVVVQVPVVPQVQLHLME
jgi:hypothetical protein